MKLQENDLNNIFKTDIEVLKTQAEDEVKFAERNHFGDMLVEKVENDNERFKLWRNLDCNDCSIEVEYAGRLNKWTWETVLTINL